MPDQLQLRGGTTSEHNSFTGALREVTVDTTKKTLVVHDGSQAGGTPLMKESGTVDPTTITIGTGGTQRLAMSNSEVVINDTGADVDFRIEGDSDTNLFKVDAGNDRIGVGIASPANTFHLHGDGTLRISPSAGANQVESGRIRFTENTSDFQGGYIHYDGSANKLHIGTHAGNDTITANDKNCLTILRGGTSIGLGTDDPQTQIHAKSASGVVIRLEDATDNNYHHIYNVSDDLYISADRNNTGSGNLIFRNGGTDVCMFINSDGKVGIGTTLPDQELHVKGVGTVATFEGSGGGGFIALKDQDDGTVAFIGTDGGKLKFQTSGGSYSDKLVIDTSGRLIVGTDSILHSGDHKFNVAATSSSASISLNRYGNTAYAAYIHFKKSRSGTIGGSTIVQANDLLGRIYFQGDDGSSPVSAAYIEAFVDGTPGNQDMPGRLVFSTAEDDTPTPVERMQIDSLGRLLLGTTTEGFATADDFTIARSGDCGMTIRAGSSSQSIIAFSDDTSGVAEYAGYLSYYHSTDELHIGAVSKPIIKLHNEYFNILADEGTTRLNFGFTDTQGGELSIYDDTGAQKIRIAGSTNTNSFFNNGGNVGIGTSNPSYALTVRRSTPSGGRMMMFGSNGTHYTGTVSSDSNGLIVFRARISVAANTTTDLVSGFGGDIVLITIGNNGGDDVQQTRVRTHGWNSTSELFLNTYGANNPTITFSATSGVLRVNHNHTGPIFFNVAGLLVSGQQSA